MSHDTHHEHGHSSDKKQTIISFKNSFWLVIILVGLFVAAINFIKAESGGEEGEGKGKEKTEMKAEGKEEHSEKKGEEAPKAEASKAEPAKDTAKGAK